MILMRPAAEADFPAILALLDRSGLPPDGLSDHVSTTLVAVDAGSIVGTAAVEVYGRAALLRSVAVDQSLRHQGLGRRLTDAALDLARRRGVTTIFLLTDTAPDFFARFGFHPVPRGDVDAAVRTSVEFTTACPESAQSMVLRLGTTEEEAAR